MLLSFAVESAAMSPQKQDLLVADVFCRYRGGSVKGNFNCTRPRRWLGVKRLSLSRARNNEIPDARPTWKAGLRCPMHCSAAATSRVGLFGTSPGM
jgi:hypothetical protein